jgi:hypothetical protein
VLNINILKKKYNNYYNKQEIEKKYNNGDYKSLTTYYNEEEIETKNKSENKQRNMQYFPNSVKEWLTNLYSYNKSYSKPLISYNKIVNNLLASYFNMLKDNINLHFKRRRPNKIRYSANKIYTSYAEFKHKNKKLDIMLYAYNKQRSIIYRFIRKTVIVKLTKQILGEQGMENTVVYKNRLFYLVKNRFIYINKWNNASVKKRANLLENLVVKFKIIHLKSQNIPLYEHALLKQGYILEQTFNDYRISLNFNKSKFNNPVIYFNWLGIVSLIDKIYGKYVNIKLVELKSVHLNSNIFSSAIGLKLRDRKNKVVRIFKKAIIKMVKIPDLHTLRIFDDSKESMMKNNILTVIKQQVVSGVRFEAAGRLTRRLTALRAIFKYRYTGSLKDLRSSLNNQSSTLLRGHVKANLQYTVINSKTRNGTFGLKGWISSH